MMEPNREINNYNSMEKNVKHTRVSHQHHERLDSVYSD